MAKRGQRQMAKKEEDGAQHKWVKNQIKMLAYNICSEEAAVLSTESAYMAKLPGRRNYLLASRLIQLRAAYQKILDKRTEV